MLGCFDHKCCSQVAITSLFPLSNDFQECRSLSHICLVPGHRQRSSRRNMQTIDGGRPLPRSWFFFTCASLLGATALLIISMLDLGYLSMHLNPCVSLYTLLYHVGVILIARQRLNPDAPSYFSTAIFTGYLMAIVWMVAFVLTIVKLASSRNERGEYPEIAFLRQNGLPVHVWTQRVQVVLTLYELVMVGGMAARGHGMVKVHGPDPPDWRYEDGGKVCSSSMSM